MIVTYVLPDEDPKTIETPGNEVVIGRSPAPSSRLDIDLISDLYVSHVHARLVYEEDHYWVEDLDSANGTFVDGAKIAEKTLLGPGSQIKIGWTLISVRMPELSDTLPRAMPLGETAPEAEQVLEWTSKSEEIDLWVSDDEMELEWVSDEEGNLSWTSPEESTQEEDLPSRTLDRGAQGSDSGRTTQVSPNAPPSPAGDTGRGPRFHGGKRRVPLPAPRRLRGCPTQEP